ncbi:DUF1573 domain-containing protein [Bdellovibrio sp. HCB288]|uniref:Ig-like domain-containing protein n=1 Tax=Bdellovibrio sp. HCB288 TaxID=3394355 RepID=UPI0039B5AEA3
MKAILLFACSLFLTVPVFAEEMEVLDDSAVDGEILITEDSVTVLETYNYNFGYVRKGKSETARFRLRNNGSYPFYIDDIETNGRAFSHTENCGGVLWPGQACRAVVKFAPKQTGSFYGRLDFELIGRSDIRVNLRGFGINW